MFKRRKLLVSIKRLKIHEFNRTLRYLGSHDGWLERFQKLSELQQQAIVGAVKSLSPLVPAYIALNSLNKDGSITVSIQSFSASIPTAYFAIFTSFIFLIGSLSLAHLSTILTLRARHSGKILLPGFSSNVVGLLGGYDAVGLGVPVLVQPFLKERLPVSRILTYVLSFSLLGVIFPFVAFGGFLLIVQYDLVMRNDMPLFQLVSAGVGILLVLFSFVFLIAFHLPFPMKKNAEMIRWLFLARISKRFPHPQSEHWLEDKSHK